MGDVWDRIEAWLKVNAPDALDNVRAGATRDAVRAAEATLGVQFPDDMVVSYLVHDGQDTYSPALVGEWQLLSLEGVVTEW